jgi:hypothetical protein
MFPDICSYGHISCFGIWKLCPEFVSTFQLYHVSNNKDYFFVLAYSDIGLYFLKLSHHFNSILQQITLLTRWKSNVSKFLYTQIYMFCEIHRASKLTGDTSGLYLEYALFESRQEYQLSWLGGFRENPITPSRFAESIPHQLSWLGFFMIILITPSRFAESIPHQLSWLGFFVKALIHC